MNDQHPTSRLPHDSAIAATITDLTWCTTAPHTLEDIASASWGRFPRTRWEHGVSTDQMAADIRAEAEEGGHVGWSDPTGDAVSSGAVYAMTNWTATEYTTEPGHPGDTGDDATPTAIDSAVDLAYYSADELVMLCLDNERARPAEGSTDKLDATIEALSRIQPLIVQARDRMDLNGRNHLDLLVYQHLSETAAWLRQKGEALVNGSKRAAQPPPLPGALPVGCVSCARDRGPDGRAYFAPIDMVRHSKRQMCRVCGDYHSGNDRMPPLAAVQYVHRTGKQMTNKVVEDALRQERAS